MTHKHAPAKGLDIITRWCGLAERRLDYLTDLYETGRWRRYHSEADFLENVREARAAVDTWRRLVGQGGTKQNLPIDWSWLDRPNGVPPPSAAMLPHSAGPVAEAALSEVKPDPAPLVPLSAKVAAPEPASLAVAVSAAAASAAPVSGLPPVSSSADWSPRLHALARERYPILRLAI